MGMNVRTTYRGWLAVSLGGTVAAAWVVLWWLEDTSWAALFHMHDRAHAHITQDYALPETAIAFVVGWTLMTVAMMLPSIFPLTEIFRRLVWRRRHAPLLIAALASGYLLVWAGLGVIVFGASQALEPVVRSLPAWTMPAGLFLLAGAFQFSALKYQCLEQCRAPLGFVLARWSASRGDGACAFRIGMDHGLFCAGCCWALMLLMFAAATAHLLWMFVLGLLMAVEKNASWGRRIGKPLGFVLLVAGVAIGASGLIGG